MTVTEPVIPKRVILSMGGKGGVGKTNVMTGLAEWFAHHQIPVTLLDLDTENKTRGSLTIFSTARCRRSTSTRRTGWTRFSIISTRVRRSCWRTWGAARAA